MPIYQSWSIKDLKQKRTFWRFCKNKSAKFLNSLFAKANIHKN